ncbi:AMP-binding protein [Rubrobacter radiotolerans]|uniref:AMP-binding protein n=1 Tax=Rubrobacter radiotolerans TaxID=42256 RepID=A0AB35T6P3_RUBRA|nr:AMP-binding protein [Rubrobacter radiotolerans]MDX5895364.1 AMP-binding protein [Rubrobacter radiotolerans]SMC01707.1 long-chain acyl-CoA synthetase [Rubrobacter radiotolerans DSM 5868]
MDRPDTLASLVDSLHRRRRRTAVLAFGEGGAERWTYAQLAKEADRVARGLGALGVGRGDHVAMLADPGPAWISAALAVLRAGASVVPLDTQLDDATLLHVLRDSDARLAFTDSGGAERLADLAAPLHTLRLDAGEEDARSWRLLKEGEGRLPEVEPSDEAVLFYTSGTTGAAKGVPLSHVNLVYQTLTLAEADLVTGKDRVLVPLPFHHVYPFVVGMLTPLSLGLPVILPEALTGPRIVHAANKGGATMIIGVPRLYRAVYEGIAARSRDRGLFSRVYLEWSLTLSTLLRRRTGVMIGKGLLAPLHRKVGPALRVLASGGSPLDEDLAWKLEGFGWRVAIGYGLTETSPLLTLNPPGTPALGSVGRPVPGTEIRIDPDTLPDGETAKRPTGTPVRFTDEPGVEGEILARGPGVFAGYRNRPEKTAEAFVGDGWFRTGDLGYFGEDGYLYLTGRVSTLIVTESGKNVQPEEIEDHYLKNPVIKEIGVLEDAGRVAALIVPDPAAVRGRGGVEEAVAKESRGLPTYRRIQTYRVSGEPLEYTRLGKLRRHALKERYERVKVGEPTEEPGAVPLKELAAEDRLLLRNPTASGVWRLLADRYPKSRIAPETDLRLDLGVDSMEWVALSLEIGRSANVELGEEEIEHVGTVRDLLRAVAAAADAGRVHTGRSPLEHPEEMLGKGQERYLQPLSPLESAATQTMYAVNRAVARILFRPRVEGLERLPERGPFVIAPNHVSYLDSFLIAAVLDGARLSETRWAGWADTVFSNPLFRLVGRLARVVPVDPHRAVLSTLALGAAVLGRGHVLVWFPEGARSPDGQLQAFRPGIGALLARHRVPVVPTFIRGTYEALPPGSARLRSRRVSITFGEPVRPEELEEQGTGTTVEERISSALRSRVARLGDLEPCAAKGDAVLR